MQLKRFQTDALETLRRFLHRARVAGSETAYKDAVAGGSAGSWAGAYRAINNLADVPYCCIRIPTGGGKTLLAAHSIKVVAESWLERDYPVVLWLVPTNTIRRQTADALKKPDHAYRRAIDEAFGGTDRVRVFDIGEFRHIRPQDMRDSVCVIVGTIQTLRVEDTNGRKVYADDENLEPHFRAVSPNAAGLERNDDGPRKGDVRFSFANLLHLHRPYLIVDEAHNAVTGLTRAMQERINPACIVEFTATPRRESNIVFNVPAAELKAADLIKLPIMLGQHKTWENAVAAALAERERLAALAAKERDYIRPIVLLQAEDKDRDVTVEILKKHLIDSHIAPERIAVATGDQRELDGIDLFARDCKIDFVITVEALKEGWDCSFAYVFCSVANVKSAQSVEQLLGRVLRMPYAARRGATDLNRAYAHVPGGALAEAAKALADGLVSLGFSEQEADDAVQPASPTLDLPPGGLFTAAPPAPEHIALSAKPDLSQFSAEDRAAVKVEEATGGGFVAIVAKPLSDAAEKAIVQAAPADAQGAVRSALRRHRYAAYRAMAPSERGVPFKLPRLAVHVQGELQLAEPGPILDFVNWNPVDYGAALSPQEFDGRDTADYFEIFLAGDSVKYRKVGDTAQLDFNLPAGDWSEARLIGWLDRQMQAWEADLVREVIQGHMLDFIGKAVASVLARGFVMARLVRHRYLLARAIVEKLKRNREAAIRAGAEKLLFARDAHAETTFRFAHEFYRDGYPADPERCYRGSFEFQKHYYGPHRIANLKPSGEEFDCAAALDSSPRVKHWVRNIPNHPLVSFWLPALTGGRSYPDFVAELSDGRLLVVEYKGDQLIGNPDTEDKRKVGAIWEDRSAGKCLYLMAEKLKDGMDVRAQIEAKIAARVR